MVLADVRDGFSELLRHRSVVFRFAEAKRLSDSNPNGAGSGPAIVDGVEDSSKLNTSFIERLNLTIRQSSAYLVRRTLCHARSKERLEEHLELLRCYYGVLFYQTAAHQGFRWWSSNPVTTCSVRWRSSALLGT